MAKIRLQVYFTSEWPRAGRESGAPAPAKIGQWNQRLARGAMWRARQAVRHVSTPQCYGVLAPAAVRRRRFFNDEE
jgi:hypothetical protein